jgi:hypothetical protein
MTCALQPYLILYAALIFMHLAPSHLEQSILLIEISSKSPGFIKYWTRCLNLNAAKALQSQKTCEAVSDAYLHLSHLGPFTSSILCRCPFKWQYF